MVGSHCKGELGCSAQARMSDADALLPFDPPEQTRERCCSCSHPLNPAATFTFQVELPLILQETFDTKKWIKAQTPTGSHF